MTTGQNKTPAPRAPGAPQPSKLPKLTPGTVLQCMQCGGEMTYQPYPLEDGAYLELSLAEAQRAGCTNYPCESHLLRVVQ